MKLDIVLTDKLESNFLNRDEIVKEFAQQFVHNLIEEAIRQSSKTTWLIHCSESCHKSNGIQSKSQKEFLCWTPECNQFEIGGEKNVDCSDYIDRVKNVSKYVLSCNSLEVIDDESNVLNDVGYALPMDAIHPPHSSKHYKVSPNCNKCFKPKAIHALNLFKSTHQKTFSDFKLFLLNLYSSSDISARKIGSEHSAFTAYCRRSNLAYGMNRVGLEKDVIDCGQNGYERCEQSFRLRKKDEKLTIVRIKNENDLIKPMRKCNRIKRCNFFNFRHSLCNVFKSQKSENKGTECFTESDNAANSFKDRSLPPLPLQTVYAALSCNDNEERTKLYKEQSCRKDCQHHLRQMKRNELNKDVDRCVIGEKKLVDFASNIEKVKDYGWYWGPMSSEAAEKLLLNEPDGSFIVRDSSDDRYIFSLTFKLNACIRHVRIEHGQGNFSFGSDTNFKSDTIVDFIENAIQHSRSGRYLFFIHRRPILGPMRVLLLYPVSRFKGHVPSLQHMCRFVILKTVRRDLISSLPLPKPVLDYLNTKDYYTEQSF